MAIQTSVILLTFSCTPKRLKTVSEEKPPSLDLQKCLAIHFITIWNNSYNKSHSAKLDYFCIERHNILLTNLTFYNKKHIHISPNYNIYNLYNLYLLFIIYIYKFMELSNHPPCNIECTSFFSINFMS